MSVQAERRELALCRGAAWLRSVISNHGAKVCVNCAVLLHSWKKFGEKLFFCVFQQWGVDFLTIPVFLKPVIRFGWRFMTWRLVAF